VLWGSEVFCALKKTGRETSHGTDRKNDEDFAIRLDKADRGNKHKPVLHPLLVEPKQHVRGQHARDSEGDVIDEEREGLGLFVVEGAPLFAPASRFQGSGSRILGESNHFNLSVVLEPRPLVRRNQSRFIGVPQSDLRDWGLAQRAH